MGNDTEPTLAVPGAGLPPLEMAVMRVLFHLRLWTGSREGFQAFFDSQRRRIHALVTPLDPATGARRALIRRTVGLEDSSRNWSVWMTLDHLRIVNHRIARVVGLLSRGEEPEGVARTQDVKPPADVDAGALATYEAACDELAATIAAVPDLRTRARYKHPWFGPLDGLGWLALAAGHMRIHRVQIERILAAL